MGPRLARTARWLTANSTVFSILIVSTFGYTGASPALAESKAAAQADCERLAAPIPAIDPETKGPGIDFPHINPAEAIPACKEAARGSDPRYVALYSIALRAGKDDIEGMKQAKKAADKGSAIAMMNIGELYWTGAGVPASGSEAVAWYLKAAQAGNAFAMARVGEMYMQGEHIPRDYPQAYMWLQKGAEAGSFTAMEHLGYAYEYGIGVPRNFTEAMTWYQKEHQASYIPAAASAATRIGYLYQYGRGVPQDYQQAAKWYREAADRGNASGMSHLGVLYQTGQGVPKSLPLAATYYQKAVQLHYDAAALYLGILYQNGWGVPKNLGSARVLFIQASRSDKPQIASAAQRLLRILHDLSDSNMGQDSPNYGLLLLVGIAIVAALSISNDTGNNVGAGTPDVSYPSPAESDKSVCWLKGIVSDWSDGFAKGLMQNQISRTGCF